MQTEHKEPEMVTDSVGKTVYVSVGDVDDNTKN